MISLVYPLVWSLLTSFKSPAEYRINITGLPEEWIWNYSFVFEKFTVRVWTGKTMLNVGVWQMLLNSLLYSVGSAVCAAFIPCIAAYACAKFKYKTSKIFFNIVVVTMVLPVVGNLPSEIQMARWFGLFDQVWGLWIMKCSALGMYFLIFHAVFKSLPDDFTEAAKVDGAGNFRIFFRIVLPVVRNTLMTVILIKFIEFWNDYQTQYSFIFKLSAPDMKDVLDIYKAGDSFNDEEQRMIMSAVTGQTFFVGSTELRNCILVKAGGYTQSLFEERKEEETN